MVRHVLGQCEPRLLLGRTVMFEQTAIMFYKNARSVLLQTVLGSIFHTSFSILVAVVYPQAKAVEEAILLPSLLVLSSHQARVA